ncbi:hypothetical protein Pla100_34840 [Neorhodopirellula pilleata]|uniref:Uncharacterized protein n=1 Tax=Neorhodopirellula pilleata TaxID=2714738 RepID=A0A5C6A755_9BACT|nr:hypothetical protein Pla100_34840 [Neorhodopirellula pilleata]
MGEVQRNLSIRSRHCLASSGLGNAFMVFSWRWKQTCHAKPPVNMGR